MMSDRLSRWAWRHPAWVAVAVCAPGFVVGLRALGLDMWAIIAYHGK
jgi:hypothetical protein